MPTIALAYQEPGIILILTQTSFLLLLNVINSILDNAIYCGLLGQVFVGIAWGTPGANWLSLESQTTIMQLGYLGLILIVYEGGLSTSLSSLKSNLPLSSLVALIGVLTPIALSFTLPTFLTTTTTPMQSFAAGAALCSTSLGTTFTILSTSGLEKSRLGVVLSSAAMIDDVAGLVMVRVITNLGTRGFDAVDTVIRPVFVSLAFAVVVPLVCWLVVRPLTLHFISLPESSSSSSSSSWQGCVKRSTTSVGVANTLLLVGLVTGASYAGTSELFAAYIAGAVASWWDELIEERVPVESSSSSSSHRRHQHQQDEDQAPATSPSSLSTTPRQQHQASHDDGNQQQHRRHHPNDNVSGMAIYNRFYDPAVRCILKPFFFASIGFSIPIKQMFQSDIVWRGLVYTILMMLGKFICGIVLVRFTYHRPPLPFPLNNLGRLLPMRMRKGGGARWREEEEKKKKTNRAGDESSSASGGIPQEATAEAGVEESGEGIGNARPDEDETVEQGQQSTTHCTIAANTSQKRRESRPAMTPSAEAKTAAPVSKLPKPQSLYPAAMLGSAMIARGEIGFLICSLAESNGVFESSSSSSSSSTSSSSSSEIYLVATWAILMCTVIGPISVGVLVKRVRRLQEQERAKKSGKADPLGIWGVM